MLQGIVQMVLRGSTHNGTAVSSTRCLTRGFKLSAGTTWTGVPSRSDSSTSREPSEKGRKQGHHGD